MAIVALLAIHTPPVQSRVLAWSVAELERRFALNLAADALRFNLLTRRVTLTNVRLAAAGHHDDPFFAADRVGVGFPWTAFRGQLRFDEIAIDGGTVTILRAADGTSNLPPGRGATDPAAPPRRLDVRNLAIRDLEFLYRDSQRDLEIRAGGVRTDLSWQPGRGAAGPLEISSGVSIRVRQRTTRVESISGDMGFDGSNVSLSQIALATPEGRFSVGGSIDRALDRPTLNLTLSGTADLASAARWTTPPIHLAGDAAVKATMTGLPSAFVLDVTVGAGRAEVGRERGVGIDAQARLTPNGIAVSRSVISPASGGEIQATLDVPFGRELPWWILAEWKELDAGAALALAEVRPLAFGSTLTGTARLDRRPGKPFDVTAHNVSTPRPSAGSRSVPLEGEVDFVIDGDRWRADQRHRAGATRVSGAVGGRWNRAAPSQSTFGGDLSVTSGNIGEASRFATRFGLSLPDVLTGASGPLEARVVLGGVFAAPRFMGTATSTGADIPSLGRTVFSAAFDASPRAVSASDIDATVGGARVSGRVAANLQTRALSGRLTLDAPSAADLIVTLPATLRLEGSLSATASLRGTVDAPEVVADLTGNAVSIAGQPIDSLAANARVVDRGVTVDELIARQGDGSLRVTGRYVWGPRTYSVDAHGKGLSWRGTLPALGVNTPEQTSDVHAQFDLDFAGAGSIDRPTGEGTVEFKVRGGAAGALIDRGVANVRLNGDTALTTLRVPSLGAFVTAHIVPRRPFDYDAIVVMNRIDLAPLATLSGLREGFLTGAASLSASAKGVLTDPAASSVFVNLQDVSADVSSVPIQLVAPSRIAWDGTTLAVDTLEAAIGTTGRLVASGQLGRGGLDTARWESTFKGELGDLLTIGRTLGVPTALHGTGAVDLVWRTTGGVDRSTATVRLEEATVGWDTLPDVQQVVLDAAFDGTTLEVTQLTGRWQDGGLQGTASLPRGVLQSATAGTLAGPAGTVALQVTGLSDAALAPWVSAERLAAIDGRLSATIDARVTARSLDGVAGTLTLDEAAFTLAGVNVSQIRPSLIDLRGGVLTMKEVAFDAGGSPLTVTGTAQVAPADQQRLSLTIRGTTDLKILSAFAPALATGGEARLNMGIGGPLNAPVLSGRIDLADAEIALAQPRIVVSELDGTIALDGQRVLFDGLAGSINGGGLTLDGGFLLDGFTPGSGGLTIQVQRAAIEYPDGLQSEANAILTLQPRPGGWTLTGDVRVERSVYSQTLSLPAVIAARRTRPTGLNRPNGFADRLRLNLFVTTQQDVRLDNNYGRLEAGAALRVVGTAASPALAGRVTLREGGNVYLAGNTFNVSRGSISFANPNRIEPDFDIELRTLVSGTDITLTLQGTLDRLVTEVRSSDPDVDSREAMAMIFGGFQGEDAVALLSAELLGATGRAIGLDALRVERGFDTDELRADPGLIATETDPSTRLTLSKRLRPDVELILSQSLRQSGGLSAIVSYKPRRNIEVRGVSRDNTDRSVALRHEITFGGTVTPDGAAQVPAVEVSDVTVSGEPGRPGAELLARLRLQRGSSFDFHQWQRDLDALRAAYHERKFYEVRVRGTRQVSEDGQTVALDYRIDPGPLAELVVEGHPLEPRLEEELRDAWSRTIFDRFLFEDIRSRVLAHLLEEDLVGGRVDITVPVATSERKQVRVVVTPGTEVRDREIRYAGNAAFAPKRLDDVVESAGLTIEGWLDPGRIADALETFYRDEGYLEADVRADEPRVDAGVGVLPVTISEGARYEVRDVAYPGVSPDRVPAVAAAARVGVGAPLVADQIDAARARIEDLYARDGFNGVQVEIDSRAAADQPRVDVSFAVLEGTRQVLREVVAEGNTRTRDAIILRALRLRVGEPVDLLDWAQARKRMYDTNVFRQVDLEPVPLAPSTEESAAGIQPVRAVVRVVEYPVWRLRYGVQVNDEELDVPDPDGDTRLQNVGVLADLQNQNVFGRAVTAGIAARYERKRQAGSLFTSNGSFFGLPIRSSGFVFTSRQRFDLTETFSTIDERMGISAEQRWRPFRTSEVIWSYRFERTHTFDPEPSVDDPFPLDVVVRASRLNAAMLFDRRDDPSDPTSGWFTAANWEQTISLLGSDGNAKLLVQQSVYRPLGAATIAARAQIGTSFGPQSLIVSERFLLGGATTVRGYAENSLAPRDQSGNLGGDALVALNAELRFPIRGWVRGVAFVDAGDVFATRGDLSLTNLAAGYGLGLRVASPYAMLRVDFGIPTRTLSPDRPANRWRSGRWYFGIGHAF